MSLVRSGLVAIFVGERFGELPKDNSSSAGVFMLSETMSFFPLS